MNQKKLKRILADLDIKEPACMCGDTLFPKVIKRFKYRDHTVKNAQVYVCLVCGEISYARAESRLWDELISEKLI